MIAKDGIPLAQPYEADTIMVAPGERYTVLIHADKPGVWAWHCHILTHAERPRASATWQRPSSSSDDRASRHQPRRGTLHRWHAPAPARRTNSKLPPRRSAREAMFRSPLP